MARSYYSTVIDASAEDVWTAARSFNGLATWFSPPVSSSEIEEGKSGEAVSGVRNFVLGGDRIRERMVAMSDVDRSYTYEFCEPKPFPVLNYRATLRVQAITDGGRSFVEWHVTFDCEMDEIDHWEAFFARDVFCPALESLKAYIGRGAEAPPVAAR